MKNINNISGSAQLVAYKSVRKGWGDLKPTNRVVESKKNYHRKAKFQKNYHEGYVD
jgi:hypothetical protein